MYSVVILMTMSGAGEAPDFGRRGCHGCSGSYSGCSGYASSCHGCRGRSHGCQGRTHGCHGRRHSCHGGCSGTIYYHGCGGTVMPKAGGHSALEAPYTGTVITEVTQPGAARATIVVKLPAVGQLNIDGYTVPTASDSHTYVTLPINPGESRSVVLTAAGKSQTISVTAGEQKEVSFASTGAVAGR